MFKSLLPSLTASGFVRHMWDIDLPAAWCCAQADSWSIWGLHTETQRHAHTETQRWKGRGGGCEGHIHRPWNRAGLAQVRASLPGHLSGIWVFQGSDVKVSTKWTIWPMTHLLNYVYTTLSFQQHSLLALLRKHPAFAPIKHSSCWV